VFVVLELMIEEVKVELGVAAQEMAMAVFVALVMACHLAQLVSTVVGLLKAPRCYSPEFPALVFWETGPSDWELHSYSALWCPPVCLPRAVLVEEGAATLPRT